MHFIFGCAGSLLLCELFSICSELGLLSSSGAEASHCCGVSCPEQALEHAASVAACTWAQLRLQDSRAQAQYLWHIDLAALQDMGSSWIRDQTHVSCTAGRFLTTKPPGKPQLHF